MPQTMLPGSLLAMTGQTADRLIQLDSGDAALLYLYLLRRGDLRGLSWPEARLRPALESLKKVGLAPAEEALPDPELSAAMTRMEKAGRSILETVEASPAKAKQVRRFANYYLPDAVNVLEQYAKLARQGVRGENAASIRAEVERNAASIATAFENQLDALYAAESMDLSADLTVLQNMMKGQGLS